MIQRNFQTAAAQGANTKKRYCECYKNITETHRNQLKNKIIFVDTDGAESMAGVNKNLL